MSDIKNEHIYDVIVIGGGASGMMAASVAASSGSDVLLLEKNRKLGSKLAITGGGRCNITNAEHDVRSLLSNYGEADKFLFSAFSRFGVQDTLDYFESRGLPIKIEGRKRAFPLSESAHDVVNLLVQELDKTGVTVLKNADVQSIFAAGSEIKYIKMDSKRLRAKQYILATGGTSRPETGSTGDGFKWLKSMGHKVNAPTPNITPLSVKESWVAKISGTVAKNIQVTFMGSSSKFSVTGNVLFTHFGISGPTVLNNAYRVAELLEEGSVRAQVNLLPHLSFKELDTQILAVLNENGAKQLKNTLKAIAPEGTARAVAAAIGNQIDLETKNSEVGKSARMILHKTLRALPLTIDRLMGFDKAVVANGGVDLIDIDTKSMRSRKISNLLITGDLLDINRPSGGYSLQLCWTTGHLAGINSAPTEADVLSRVRGSH